MNIWKVNCMEDTYPGMWQRWFRNQCVAVGWPAPEWKLHERSSDSGWRRTRAALLKVQPGDYVIASLRGHRIGRLGQVTGIAIEDNQWKPLVPKSREQPNGEMGRRLLVRWDLTVGPGNAETVVYMPEGGRFNIGELRPTVSRIQSLSLDRIKEIMNDSLNWQSLLSHFDYERALSGYIATYPHHLEDGLTPHPDKTVREKVFADGTRSDVLLLDRDEKTVIVECKQGPAEIGHIEQLRKYLRLYHKETGQRARGILVHGGARRIDPKVSQEASRAPKVQVVQHRLSVEFSDS